jgi:hypothetical protein
LSSCTPNSSLVPEYPWTAIMSGRPCATPARPAGWSGKSVERSPLVNVLPQPIASQRGRCVTPSPGTAPMALRPPPSWPRTPADGPRRSTTPRPPGSSREELVERSCCPPSLRVCKNQGKRKRVAHNVYAGRTPVNEKRPKDYAPVPAGDASRHCSLAAVPAALLFRPAVWPARAGC